MWEHKLHCRSSLTVQHVAVKWFVRPKAAYNVLILKEKS